MIWHRIEIVNESDKPVGYMTNVLLDGQPLRCRSIRVDIDAQGINQVTVVLDAVLVGDFPAELVVADD